ncbi:HTH domain-containing protein [Listeria booriae]|uniref:HTH domain-containing protein n=1 Tax=Listeria booriae TaxID=1552123 RepID=A0A7X1DPZ4_9LIST|nr:helix-turn-helix domain-containing protein [Listeria booriae]MBC2169768.1 HTH domain-containing protein [Listeria booriae]MBC2370674.1 HTH domain-containing protein [Listeria booriae]
MFYIENLFELEKNLGRYVNILKILSERSGWFSCHFLAKKLNCSEKTVRRNIQEMNSQFPINWFIQSEVRKGVQLQKPMNESIYPIYRRFFQNTITYQILEAIYYEKHHNVTEIAEDLFISVPVAYKLINMLEKNLATLQLSISKKPIKLVGDEENVRLFYYYIFSDIGDYNAFFPEDELKRIVHYVQQIETSVGENFSISFHYRAIYFIGVTLQRVRLHHHVTYEPTSQLVTSQNAMLALLLVNEQIEAQEKITLSPAEQHWIIRVFFDHVPITFEQAENIGQTMLETKTFLSLIQELEHEFGIDLQHDPLFLDMMIQNVEYEHVPNLKHDYLFLQDHRMQEFILENYFNTYLQVKKIYNYFDAQNAIYQIGTTRNIMDTVIFMITKKVYALTQKAKVCVLVTSRGDIWSNFLKTLIENHFGSRVVIREVSSILKIDSNIWKDADFIIADFDFKYNHVPNIIIDPIPSQRDFENIERFLVTKEMKLSEVD